MERPEPDLDLDPDGRQQGQGQDAKGQAERAPERRVRRRQLPFVRGDDHAVGLWDIGKRDGPFHGNQPLPVGTRDPVAVDPAVGG